MEALNPMQLELIKLFENEPPTAENLIGLRKVLHQFLKKKNRGKDLEMERQVMAQVKAKVLEIDPNAKVILYGSRARGDSRKESDWDFLVLTEKEATFEFGNTIIDAVNDIEIEIGEVISTITFNKEEWERRNVTQFYKNVKKDGVEV